MFLVVSAMLLAATLTATRRFDVRDLAISGIAMAPVAVGMVICCDRGRYHLELAAHMTERDRLRADPRR